MNGIRRVRANEPDALRLSNRTTAEHSLGGSAYKFFVTDCAITTSRSPGPNGK